MIQNTNISLNQCFNSLKELKTMPVVYVDQIPDVLQQDFNNFIIGKTLSEHEGRSITHDFDAYYHKIYFGPGIDYPVQWNGL